MDLPALHEGRILRRYKRFLADIELADGQVVVAHCPNTGSMVSCWEPGAPVQIVHSTAPGRKLSWTLERIDMGAGWIGVNTHRVNAVIAEAAALGNLPGLEHLRQVRREVSIPPQGDGERARLDLLLEGAQARAYVEIKNTTLLRDGLLQFPDAVSLRARKHLGVLRRMVDGGDRAMILFAVNRPEGSVFQPADHIDPEYGRVLREVAEQGVELLAVRLVHSHRGINVGDAIPIGL